MTIQQDDLDTLLTIKQASKLLNLKQSRLRTAVLRKEVPFVKLGRLVRFKRTDLEAWVNSKTIGDKK